MRHFTALFIVLGFAEFTHPANAKSSWDQLAETASVIEQAFDQVEMTAPRSDVFTALEKTASRAEVFRDVSKNAP